MVLDEDIAQIAADNNIDWKRLKNSTILVTGATGLIGSLCIRVLLSLDFPVRGEQTRSHWMGSQRMGRQREHGAAGH